MLSITLHLPIYLIKYMRTLYGEPYAPKASDEIGIYILNALQRKSNLSEYQYRAKKELSQTYQLTINTSNYEKRGAVILPQQNALIVKFVDSHFRRELFRTAVMNHYYYSIPYKFTIINILRSYNIEENDLPYFTFAMSKNNKVYMKTNELLKILREAGCEPKRQAKGSHQIWWNPETGKQCTVPIHPSKEVGTGLVKKITKELLGE